MEVKAKSKNHFWLVKILKVSKSYHRQALEDRISTKSNWCIHHDKVSGTEMKCNLIASGFLEVDTLGHIMYVRCLVMSVVMS